MLEKFTKSEILYYIPNVSYTESFNPDSEFMLLQCAAISVHTRFDFVIKNRYGSTRDIEALLGGECENIEQATDLYLTIIAL